VISDKNLLLDGLKIEKRKWYVKKNRQKSRPQDMAESSSSVRAPGRNKQVGKEAVSREKEH